MGRSIKKGPFVDLHLQEKIQKTKETKSKAPIKTWSRRSMITPDFVGITFNVHMSPQKMREVVRQIQGLPAPHAQAVLAVVPRKGARIVAKTLKSAIANAEDLKTHKQEYRNMNT